MNVNELQRGIVNLKKAEAKQRRERYEDLLALQLKASGLIFERQHKFHPHRRWRFDFAIHAHKLAIEIDGAVWTSGRHTRGSGFVKDCEKLNEAVILGWAVLRFPATEIKSGRPISAILRYIASR